jgi:hypothetical protein
MTYPQDQTPPSLRAGARTAIAATILAAAAIATPAAAQDPYLAGHTVEWLVDATVLAAPAALRDGAEVRAWTGDGHLVTLREGSNGIICLGPRPGAAGSGGFAVACYHDSLEPFMERGRELQRQGVEGRERDEARWREIREGVLPMPAAAMVYNLGFPDADFDPADVDPATGRRLHALYLRDATVEATGLPGRPADGAPWLMFPGTPSAHVMISIPPRLPD